jgi:hypothetical protein
MVHTHTVVLVLVWNVLLCYSWAWITFARRVCSLVHRHVSHHKQRRSDSCGSSMQQLESIIIIAIVVVTTI